MLTAFRRIIREWLHTDPHKEQLRYLKSNQRMLSPDDRKFLQELPAIITDEHKRRIEQLAEHIEASSAW